ncbi:hypothetical protein GO755_21860 [Spirosoma sp. HMF4905]|uniref:Uncharacterized protein n=1 Tax=Spirosoma arboris TaxID=2682092 RepID=A0A7K1SFX1_9BACT|nr:hypothetical protein [Spirosoma arboris]MVM32702.1 hypothetical protein [Spirosoma arboris]
MKNSISILLLLGVVLSCKKRKPESTPFSIQSFDRIQEVVGTIVMIQGISFGLILLKLSSSLRWNGNHAD